MQKQLLSIPVFKNEDEEFEFWSTHDTTDYFDWSNAEHLSFPNLKPTNDIDLKLKEMLVIRDIERLAQQQHTSKRELIVRYLTDAVQRQNAEAPRVTH
ncbi:MAG TPA: CopG family antitoxin [Candidatus Kapabacteria bacterium]|nr:CopG family antitoxin [Candidatus Kapabacteria bacterium]